MDSLIAYLKKAFKSRTINASLLISILGLVQTNLHYFQLDQKTQGLVLIGIGTLFAILRMDTDKSISDK